MATCVELFERFYGSRLEKSKARHIDDKVLRRLHNWVQKHAPSDVTEMEEFLTCEKNNKTGAKEILQEFYQYYERQGYEIGSSCLDEYIIIDDKVHRAMEILRFLLGGVAPEEITRIFCISDATLKRTIRELRDGIYFYGDFVKLKEDRARNGHYELEGTRVPFFLLMDSKSRYLVEECMKFIRDDPLFGDDAEEILSKLENQYNENSMLAYGRRQSGKWEEDSLIEDCFDISDSPFIREGLKKMLAEQCCASISATTDQETIYNETCRAISYDPGQKRILFDFEDRGQRVLSVYDIADVELL